MNRALSNRPVNVDLGILLIRLGIGLSLLYFHGWDKLAGGSAMWAGVGGSMGSFGLGLPPVFWGFMAAFSESFGSAMLALGLLFRPVTLMLAFTMIVAVSVHLNMPPENANAGLAGAANALVHLSVYVGLFFAGAGRFSVTFTRSES